MREAVFQKLLSRYLCRSMEGSNRLAAWLISPSAKSAMTCEMSLMTCTGRYTQAHTNAQGVQACQQHEARWQPQHQQQCKAVYTSSSQATCTDTHTSYTHAPPCCPGLPRTTTTVQKGNHPPAPPHACHTCC